MQNEQLQYRKKWDNIPPQAFLYFPNQEEIKIGTGQKQWRKIFEGGQIYDTFEQQKLQKLQQTIVQQKAIIDPWFDKANKLRFLQANKFKVSNTFEAMQQYTKWRKQQFPVKQTPEVLNLLNSGAFYFSGRDNKYRPIIVADISKIKQDDAQSIPYALVLMMQFMIKQLLIEGQVQNYILIMNLQVASFAMRGIITKIMSFTSNSYRGRLFASYLLAMPSILRWGWDALISKFVSQNTLKKIRISSQFTHQEMWTHISPDTIQKIYGGNLLNKIDNYWPPEKDLLLFTNKNQKQPNKLISKQQYQKLYDKKKLIKRKINAQFIKTQEVKQMQQLKKRQIQKEQKLQSILNLAKELKIRTQTSFIKDTRTIRTFFQTDAFKKICLNQNTLKGQ